MSHRHNRIGMSTADDFLETRRHQHVSGVFGQSFGWIASLPQRIAEHHRRTVLRRQTMDAMGKLNERMMKDIGWPGRYDPQGRRRPEER